MTMIGGSKVLYTCGGARFNVANLSDIRVGEYEFGRPKDGGPDGSGRTRVQVMAFCKVPANWPRNCSSVKVRLGNLVWSNAKETSELTASGSGLAKDLGPMAFRRAGKSSRPSSLGRRRPSENLGKNKAHGQ